MIHVFLIGYGIYAHAERLPQLVPETLSETAALARNTGWITVVGIMMLAYSQGGGTYTGLEAVSNNVNTLAEPRVTTGKWTMLYMAISLAFTAGGIMLLYLLWDAAQQPGQTLNAVVFQSIIEHLDLGSAVANHAALHRRAGARRRRSSSSPPTPASSAARRCCPTWRPTRGCRAISASSRAGS